MPMFDHPQSKKVIPCPERELLHFSFSLLPLVLSPGTAEERLAPSSLFFPSHICAYK